MHIYEFICQNCHRRVSFLVRGIFAPFVPKCSSYGSANLSRIISGFTYHKALKTVWEESSEPTIHPGDAYYRDRRNIGRWMEKISVHRTGDAIPDS